MTRRSAVLAPLAAGLILSLGLASASLADDLYKRGSWPALASDRTAARIGDSLTIVVFENATASNSSQKGTGKRTRLKGEIIEMGVPLEAGSAAIDTEFQGNGQTARSGRMVAQISVVVEDVMPNGDLRVSGRQTLNINGEKTTIRVRGRVRTADISADNTVLSSRLADATIDYNGSGFISRSAQPGIVNRIFNWLGFL